MGYVEARSRVLCPNRWHTSRDLVTCVSSHRLASREALHVEWPTTTRFIKPTINRCPLTATKLDLFYKLFTMPGRLRPTLLCNYFYFFNSFIDTNGPEVRKDVRAMHYKPHQFFVQKHKVLWRLKSCFKLSTCFFQLPFPPFLIENYWRLTSLLASYLGGLLTAPVATLQSIHESDFTRHIEGKMSFNAYNKDSKMVSSEDS